ncbi:MAG: SDR family oxidoreductase [Anaerolineales bacterium]|jgi:NAD(P)-dependent dehydrogenase (short-subunit alcohol dehydrogenase family)
MKNIYSYFDLRGRTALVTGAAGLLGMEFCRTLGEAGAAVVLADVQFAAAEEVAETLARVGLQTLPVQMDVTNPTSVNAAVQAALEQYGRLDILVNSAALDPKFDPENQENLTRGDFETYPLPAWQQALDVNLTGMFLTCQAAVKPMLAQGSGVIINICSIYGLVGPDQRLYERPDAPRNYKPVYYSVTKAGVLGLTRYLATYYAGKNIRINALTPGGVFNQHDEVFLQAYAARTVLGRMAEKDEMNGALLFLASDASAYMTGANLVVDGGWSAW